MWTVYWYWVVTGRCCGRRRDTADSQHLPMLGINLGTLGYLTEVEKNGTGRWQWTGWWLGEYIR